MQNSGKKEKMATRVLPKPLRFENYDFFFNNPVSSASTLNFHQLNQIVQIHGFYKLNHENRRKEMVLVF
ncbi:hypothetical protein BVRB_3g054130 [Beta vulgaris subsp. vulgaris]|nr:hypothetical protein BVRB_3g054130 [Beta vulgaris subsp. vulgaris]